MYSDAGDTTSLVPGFPIRTSSDQRSVGSSPRLIAASYVLHRLPVPRHPPCALKHLQHTKLTNQFGKIAHQPTPQHQPKPAPPCRPDARNHYPQIKHHTPPPRWSDNRTSPRRGKTTKRVASKPNSVSDDPAGADPQGSAPHRHVCCAPEPPPLQRTAHPTNRPETCTPAICGTVLSLVVLLRKEVIQPHLPVRLPCYDFVPITDPTFGSSLLAVGPLTSGVTDFRDVTGGVYKARERIHRSVADLRLLATPTSRGRVADPDPN